MGRRFEGHLVFATPSANEAAAIKPPAKGCMLCMQFEDYPNFPEVEAIRKAAYVNI